MKSIRIVGKLPPPIGGVTISTQRLYQRLKSSNNFSVKFSVLNEYETDDVGIEKVSNLFFWMLKRLLIGFSEELIHYQGADLRGLLFLGLVCKMHPKNKLIWSVHSEYLIPKIEKLIYKKIVFSVLSKAEVIADNENIRYQLKNNNIQSKVVFPFLMPPNYMVDNTEGVQSDKPILLFNAYKIVFNSVGQDVYGLNTLLQAFSLLEKKCLLVLLIPTLEAKEKQYVERLLYEAGLTNSSNIRLVSDEKTNGLNWIASSDIFIRPTITDGDALSLREALYLGIPSIASDCVRRPENTVLFANNDSKDLSQKITIVLSELEQIKDKLKRNKYDAFDNFVEFYRGIKS